MNIQVNNLDNGYNSCAALNNLSVVDGEKLISDLGSTIKNLINHWKGSDADTHISKLNSVYNALIAVVGNAKKITSTAGSAMIALQEIRRANGGTGEVGMLLPNTEPDADPINVPTSSGEYYCDPAAKTDLTDLITICTNFDSFKTKFESEKDALMLNWTAGANREGAVNSFDSFTDNATTYANILKAAKDNLDIAVSNLASV